MKISLFLEINQNNLSENVHKKIIQDYNNIGNCRPSAQISCIAYFSENEIMQSWDNIKENKWTIYEVIISIEIKVMDF